jgi:hypothetical protein
MEVMEVLSKIIKVNFTSYKNMQFGVWINWCKSELNWYDYFISQPLDELDKRQIDFVNNWLGFLIQPYELQNNENLLFDKQNVLEKTLRQKIEAITYLQKHQKVYEFLPKFLEIFGNKKQNEIMQMPFYLAYEQGFFYMQSLLDCETAFMENLKKHTPTAEEIKAGYNELSVFSNYGLYDNLAGGDVLKHELVLNLDVETAHTKIIYNNHLQHYQKKLQDIIHKKSIKK